MSFHSSKDEKGCFSQYSMEVKELDARARRIFLTSFVPPSPIIP